MAPPPGAAGEIRGFLRRARRRFLLREALAALLIAAVADIAFSLGAWNLARAGAFRYPALAIGPPLAALLLLRSALGLRERRLAERADRAFGLKDRLVSHLAFRRQGGVEAAFRAAQAEETALALRALAPAGAIRVPRLLWAAPALFAWMLYFEYLPLTDSRLGDVLVPRVVREARRAAAPGGDAPAEPGEGAPPPGGERAAERRPGAGEAGSGKESPAAKGPDRPPPAEWEEAPEERTAGGEGSPAAAPLDRTDAAIDAQPARLFSDEVGARLTPVVEPRPPVGAPAASRAEEAAGRVAFRLVPAGGGEETGAGGDERPGGGRRAPLEIVVDFDAVPPALRGLVRRYYGRLGGVPGGERDGT